MNKQHVRKLAREGKISRGALKNWLANSVPDDVADNGTVAGAVRTNHINANGRMWPKESAVKQSNDLKGWSKQRGPVRSSGSGQYYYGGPNSRANG